MFFDLAIGIRKAYFHIDGKELELKDRLIMSEIWTEIASLASFSMPVDSLSGPADLDVPEFIKEETTVELILENSNTCISALKGMAITFITSDSETRRSDDEIDV